MQIDESQQDIMEPKQLLKQTFSNRRELIVDKVSVEKVRQQYPGLLTVDGVLCEYSQLVDRNVHGLLSASRKDVTLCTRGVIRLTEKLALAGKSKSSKLCHG